MLNKFGISIISALMAIALILSSVCMAAEGQKDILVKKDIFANNQRAYAICIVNQDETRYHNLSGQGLENWLQNAETNKEYLVVTTDENFQTILVQQILEARDADVQDLVDFKTIQEGLATADVLRRMNSRDGYVVRVIIFE